MALQEHNYWLTTAEFPTTDPSRPLPEVLDVAVIGSGFTGLSAARTLAKRGAKVGVLEAETIGWGASSRNGGMVLTGMKLGVNKLISMYGREWTRRMYAASLASMDCVEQIVRDYTATLERWVRRYPEQYFWHHRRWKHQQAGTPPELGDPS